MLTWRQPGSRFLSTVMFHKLPLRSRFILTSLGYPLPIARFASQFPHVFRFVEWSASLWDVTLRHIGILCSFCKHCGIKMLRRFSRICPFSLRYTRPQNHELFITRVHSLPSTFVLGLFWFLLEICTLHLRFSRVPKLNHTHLFSSGTTWLAADYSW